MAEPSVSTDSDATPPTAQQGKSHPRSGDRLSAGLMLLGTALALLWANSPWGETYHEFWDLPVGLNVGEFHVSATLHQVVNDVLMTVFFFLVGLEVKRELTIGELTDRSRAVVPIAAAVAGLVVPALIYLPFGQLAGEPDAWGIVISMDTAFLLGALALIGPAFPQRLRTFLLTLAVVDDIGALAVIALFYSASLELAPLAVAIALLGLIALVRLVPAGRGLLYTLLGAALWAAVFLSGIHPTLAGVAVALLIPVFPPRRADVEQAAEMTRAFRESPNPEYAAALTRSVRRSLSINERIDMAWRPYVAYGVLPLFALANAGVHLDPEVFRAAFTSPLTWGVIAGLIVGKFVGITGATALVRASGKGQLAPGLAFHRVAGGAALSGIGFTISLFIVPIAIRDAATQDLARVGVLAASVLAFALGWAIIAVGDRLRPPKPVGARLARDVDPERDHIVGPADAPRTVVEYGDFECPFCSRATGSMDAVLDHFGEDVRWVWRHLPLDQVHPHAREAAAAAEAAGRQGRFYEMARLMFTRQERLERPELFDYAEQLGLDLQRFAKDFSSPQVLAQIQDDRLDAEVMDLHSTPTFFINGVRHVGPYDSASLIRALEGTMPLTVE